MRRLRSDENACARKYAKFMSQLDAPNSLISLIFWLKTRIVTQLTLALC